jgi:hypothetical protein
LNFSCAYLRQSRCSPLSASLHAPGEPRRRAQENVGLPEENEEIAAPPTCSSLGNYRHAAGESGVKRCDRSGRAGRSELDEAHCAHRNLFARLISHQPAVLFSQNEPATSNQPQPASSTLLSEQTSTSHQPPANRTGMSNSSIAAVAGPVQFAPCALPTAPNNPTMTSMLAVLAAAAASS